MGSGYFHTTYRNEIRVFQTRFVKFWLMLFFVFLAVLPWMVGKYPIYLVNVSMIAIIGALGINILTGYTGQVSLGHAAFIAIGAYSSGILANKVGLSFWLALPSAGIIAGFFGLMVGIPALRLRGLYLIMATMAFGFITQYALAKWVSLTGGAGGMLIPYPKIGEAELSTDKEFYYLIVAITILAVIFARNLFRTRVGRAFIAIRDQEVAAKIIGVNLTKYKVLAFVVSSFYAGIAGSLYAHYLTSVAPDQFPLSLSIQYIAMIIVGGMGSIVGSIFGPLFITLLPEAVKLLADSLVNVAPSLERMVATSLFEINNLVYGLIIVVFLIFEPEGLYGRWRTIKTYWTRWPYTY